MDYLQKKKADVDCLKEDKHEFVKFFFKNTAKI